MEPVEFDAPRVRIFDRRPLRIAAGLALAALACFGSYFVSPFPVMMLALPSMGLLALLSLYFFSRAQRGSTTWSRVRADEQGLHSDGHLELPRAEIATGHLQPRPGKPPLVVVQGKR